MRGCSREATKPAVNKAESMTREYTMQDSLIVGGIPCPHRRVAVTQL
jgi:hypothetical protein